MASQPHYPVSSAVEAQAAALRLLTRPPAGVDPLGSLPQEERAGVVPHLTRLLATAPAYYWSRPLGRLLEALAPDFPADWQLVPEALLTPSGWAWFDPPLTLPLVARLPLRLAAVLWGRREGGSSLFGLWFASTDGVRTAVPWVLVTWQFGSSLAALTHEAVGEYPDTDDAPALAAALRLLAAGLALASQELLVAPTAPIDRHARKRLTAAAVLPLPAEPVVRVVELRRRQPATAASRAPEDHAPLEWSCQWVVRGHWRRQPYPSRGIVQPIWIHSYVKGPADKPIKPPRTTVFAVVR